MIDFYLLSNLLVAALLSGIIGLEREMKERPAGLRTHMLVCVGATMLTMVSMDVFGSNPDSVARVIAGIITGIGFLGAGTIINSHHHVRGLTTAAGVWTVAGIGVVLGLGQLQLAIMSTIIIWVLIKLYKVENYLHKRT